VLGVDYSFDGLGPEIEEKIRKALEEYKIDISNNFTTYDRLLSIRSDNRYAYISNAYGLQLISKGLFVEIYERK